MTDHLAGALAVCLCLLALSFAGCTNCPLEASECPDDCAEIRGSAYDDERACMKTDQDLLGCASIRDIPATDGCVLNTEEGLPYSVNIEYGAELIEGSDRWEECSEDDRQLLGADACGADGG